MTYDVIIIGGGIVGASAAYALSQREQSVLLLDQYAPGHEHGSSHGDGRIVRFNYTESIYVQMAQLAFPAWQRLSDAAGEPLVQQTGLIEYGAAACEPIALSEQHLADSDIPFETLSPQTANERFPQFHFADDTRTLYQSSGAVAFATLAVKALWRLTRANGGETLADTRITHIDATDTQVTVHAENGATYTGSKLVLAAGSWMQSLCAMLGLDIPLTVTQEVLCYYPAKETSNVNHRVGVMPAMVDYHDEETPFYCLPQVEIPGVKAGWHHSGIEIDPTAPRPPASEHIVDNLNGWIERTFPHLVPEPIETLTCLYTNTPDYHFVLDTHPALSNVVVAAGFSGHGFKFGSIVGDLLAALTLDEQPALPLDTFQLARFADDEALHPRVGA